MTQSELGARLGRTQQAVAMWESGNSYPSKKSMDGLKQVLPMLASRGNPPKLESPPVPYQRDDSPVGDSKGEPPTGMGPFADRLALEGDVINAVLDALPEGLRRNYQRIRTVDYSSDKLALEISVLLPTVRPLTWGLPAKLWRMSSLRLQFEGDERQYGLMVIAINTAAHVFQSHRMARITYEASLHGLFIKVVSTPQEAAAFITAVEEGTVALMSDFNGDEDLPDD